MQQFRSCVLDNCEIADQIYQIRLAGCELARTIVPGQFVMVRAGHQTDPLLGRAFALYDVVYDENDDPIAVDLVYQVMGKMTSLMTSLQKDQIVDVWGPLGNGFPVRKTRHLMMVAGGIGQTPFLALARENLGIRKYGNPIRESIQTETCTLCYGVRNKKQFAGLRDFESIGVNIQLATEDGSEGYQGRVTNLAAKIMKQEKNPPDLVIGCGPEPMMAALAGITREHHITCLLSLETPMACGFGACFSCVTAVFDEQGGWDYRRVCTEGPVFDARVLKGF